MFQTVSDTKLCGRSILTSLLLHGAGIVLLCLAGSARSPLVARVGRRFVQMALTVPVLEIPAHPVPRRPQKPIRAPRRFEAPPRVREVAAEVALNLPPVFDPILAPPLEGPPAPPPMLRAPVKPAGFAAAESAGTDPRLRRLTPTGGFDTSNAPAVAISAHPATPRAGAFGDATAAAPPPASAHKASGSSILAAEILDKPLPAYTAEARRLKIEGEVLLEVVFQASGETKVLRLIRGLGHGLDETAMAAAGLPL